MNHNHNSFWAVVVVVLLLGAAAWTGFVGIPKINHLEHSYTHLITAAAEEKNLRNKVGSKHVLLLCESENEDRHVFEQRFSIILPVLPCDELVKESKHS